jgi:tripartite-type tricarboxylate transporter receptor subunit TctC
MVGPSVRIHFGVKMNKVGARFCTPCGLINERRKMFTNGSSWRWVFKGLVCGALLSVLNLSAQGFPTKAITIVVPYAPGATDREARKIAELAAKHLGQTVLVENRDGAGGTIGAAYVARANPDGYTLLYSAPAVLTVAPLVGKPPYVYEDLMPLARASITPHYLAARIDAPFRNAREMVAYAKSNPGKLTFGSPGNGTAVHLAGEALADAAGFQFTHVPHRGLAPALTAVMGGFVDVVIGAPGVINAQVEAGKLRPIAQFGATRATALSNVPTLKEQGIDLALRADFGFFAPKGLPTDVVQRLNEALQKAIESEEFKSFVAVSLVAPAFLNASDYQAVVDAERAIYARVVPKLALGNR